MEEKQTLSLPLCHESGGKRHINAKNAIYNSVQWQTRRKKNTSYEEEERFFPLTKKRWWQSFWHWR